MTATRTGRSSRVAVVVAAVVLVGFIIVLATRDTAGVSSGSQLVGKPAPPIRGATLAGDFFDLDDHRGKWVVVNFFATYCVPCRIEHPELIEFSEKHDQTGDAIVVSVAYDSRDLGALAEFFEEFGGDWPVVIEDFGPVVLDYGVVAVPESFLVDPAGIIVHKFVGGVTVRDIEGAIERAVAGNES